MVFLPFRSVQFKFILMTMVCKLIYQNWIDCCWPLLLEMKKEQFRLNTKNCISDGNVFSKSNNNSYGGDKERNHETFSFCIVTSRSTSTRADDTSELLHLHSCNSIKVIYLLPFCLFSGGYEWFQQKDRSLWYS